MSDSAPKEKTEDELKKEKDNEYKAAAEKRRQKILAREKDRLLVQKNRFHFIRKIVS